ncbi:MAG TPA: Plug domain-containing protein, partial [Burkholderiaceae bacterium]|nr:Plug domain-containing protein [Burkholderiaceae bacterium]
MAQSTKPIFCLKVAYGIRRNHPTITTLMVATSLLLQANVFAQSSKDLNTPDAVAVGSLDNNSDSKELGQVVVTAQKRSQLLQTVPVSVTAIDAQGLEHMGIESLSDLAREAPGLTVISAGPGQNILVMRGISSTAGTAGTVGYYLDDTPIAASSNASLLSARGLIDPSVFDISRVEVLRGPQGTLYG